MELIIKVDFAMITKLVMMIGYNYVDILPRNVDDNVELFDENGVNKNIVDMKGNKNNENIENDASLQGGGEYDIPSLIFRQLN